MSLAYIKGALHDATERKYTYRLSQKEKQYVEFIASLLHELDHNAWVYQEGKNRNVFVVEFAKSALKNVSLETENEITDFIRGFFDAEGSVPTRRSVRPYVYFGQKDKRKLEWVKNQLQRLGIKCGKIHNPSMRVDPQYWRFYISCKSHKDFANKIGSWHPRKSQLLRMMI